MHSHHGTTLTVHYNSDYSGILTITTMPPNAGLGIKQPSAVRKYLPLIEQVRTVRPQTRSEEKP